MSVERRRRRHLASDARTARYGRNQLWAIHADAVRRNWRTVLVCAVLPAVTAVPVLVATRGGVRAGIVGAAAVSGLWLAVAVVVLGSGTAARLSGLWAEASTASALRGAARDGWLLVNGLMLRTHRDVDHVAIGAAGVVVVETKWIGGGRWADQQLVAAQAQLEANRRDVANHFARRFGGVPVYGAVVVWGDDPGTGPVEPAEPGRTAVLAGPTLRSWLGSLPRLDPPPDSERLWSAVADFADLRDQHRSDHETADRPTLAVVYRRALQYPAGGAAAVYLTVWVLSAGWVAATVWLAGGTAAGVAAARNPTLRRAATAWTIALSALAATLAVASAVFAFR